MYSKVVKLWLPSTRLCVHAADLRLRLGPQRRGGVDGFEFVGGLAVFLDRHADRESDVV
jgi:hypothetical protein